MKSTKSTIERAQLMVSHPMAKDNALDAFATAMRTKRVPKTTLRPPRTRVAMNSPEFAPISMQTMSGRDKRRSRAIILVSIFRHDRPS